MIEVNGKTFHMLYYPFFRIETFEYFTTFGMRLPSGKIEEVVVFETETPTNALNDYCVFLIKEYVLEDDIMLTPRALQLKKDLMELFYE